MSVTRAMIAAEMPANILLDALDDNRDGVEDVGLLDAIIANAVLIGGTNDAAVLALTLYTLYRRLGRADKDNPFTSQANAIRTGGAGALSSGSEYTAPDAQYAMTQLEGL